MSFAERSTTTAERDGVCALATDPDQVRSVCRVMKTPGNELEEVRCVLVDEVEGDMVDAMRNVNNRVTRVMFAGLPFGPQANHASVIRACNHPNVKVERLTLRSVRVDIEVMLALHSVLTLEDSKLRSLCIRQTRLSPELVMQISEVLEDSRNRLRDLELVECDIGDQATLALASSIRHPNCGLHSLDLKYNPISREAMKMILWAVSESRCVSRVDISWGKSYIVDVRSLTMSSSWLQLAATKLERLTLSGLNLTERDICDLASAIKSENCRLEWLDVACNRLDSDAVFALAESLQHPNNCLKGLVLWDCPIGFDGISAIGSALKHPNCKLEFLDFRVKLDVTSVEGSNIVLRELVQARTSLRGLLIHISLPMLPFVTAALNGPNNRLRELGVLDAFEPSSLAKQEHDTVMHFIKAVRQSNILSLRGVVSPFAEALESSWFRVLVTLLSARTIPRLGARSSFTQVPFAELVARTGQILGWPLQALTCW